MAEHVSVPKGAGVVVAWSGLNLLRCFAEARIHVTVADSDPNSLTLRSAYARSRRLVACPRTQPEQAVRDLVVLGRQFDNRPMLAFDNEPALLLAARNRQTLSRYYRFLLPDSDLVEDLTCKLRFAALVERLALPVPMTMAPEMETTADEIAERMGLPCVLKPGSHTGRYRLAVETDQRFAYKVLQADSLEQLRRQYQRIRSYCDSFVVQEYVPGDDTSLYSYHTYLDRNSKPLGCFVGRKIRTCPKGSGGSAYLELVHEPELAELGLTLLRRMNAVGPMKIDFKRDARDGRWHMLECNARFTLWNYLGAASGMNLPVLAMADLYERPVVTPATYRTDVRWLSFANDFRAFWREYRPEGDWTWAQWLWSLRSRKIHDVFSWRDPKPAIICAARYLRLNWRKLRRCLTHKGGNAPAPVPLQPETPREHAASVAASMSQADAL